MRILILSPIFPYPPASGFAIRVELLDNRALAGTLATEGRALVERRYRWQTVVEHLEQFYGTLLHTRSAAAARSGVQESK